MNVCLDGEEQVVAAGVVPGFGRRTHGPDPSGHQLVCLAGTRECCMVVSRDEHDCWPRALGMKARVGEAPATQVRRTRGACPGYTKDGR
jgi:hypothetical protein